MSELDPLENLVFELIHCRNEAMSLGDDLLVYLLNMTIMRARKKTCAVRQEDVATPQDDATSPSSLKAASVHYLPNGPTERILLRLFTPLSQPRYEVDSGRAKGGIVDSHEGA
jgi:hypothetical protein